MPSSVLPGEFVVAIPGACEVVESEGAVVVGSVVCEGCGGGVVGVVTDSVGEISAHLVEDTKNISVLGSLSQSLKIMRLTSSLSVKVSLGCNSFPLTSA